MKNVCGAMMLFDAARCVALKAGQWWGGRPVVKDVCGAMMLLGSFNIHEYMSIATDPAWHSKLRSPNGGAMVGGTTML